MQELSCECINFDIEIKSQTPERKKDPEFLSEKPEQQALAAAAIGSLKIPSFLQQQTKVMHPKYYKHLKKCSPKQFGQTKNGLVSDRLTVHQGKLKY